MTDQADFLENSKLLKIN